MAIYIRISPAVSTFTSAVLSGEYFESKVQATYNVLFGGAKRKICITAIRSTREVW